MKNRIDYKWYNKNWFKKMAPVYDYVEFLLINLRKKVSNKVNNPNAKILDVACGTGNQSIAFAKNGFSVIGIDLSSDMLKYAKKKIKKTYDLKFVCCDATRIPYKKSSFDISSISFGLHDMPEEIGIKILKEMKRTTKKNGNIIIVDYYTPRERLASLLGHKIVK
ncbi:methyltransferase domain-containing protein, partial [Candidatus Pacearchaeota archaeon]|nr:methyltransferase domain-containing protein [Candidatus Pacearchaeota archaeon]